MSTTTSSRKAIDKAAVKKAAEELFDANGKTTTLEVKEKLRADGFFALQNEVSQFMSEISAEEDWDYQSNGQFNTYYPADDTDDDLDTDASAAPSSTSTTSTNSVQEVIEDEFKIHKFAMSADSTLGDLSITGDKADQLSDELNSRFGKELSDDLKQSSTTLKEIQEFLDEDEDDSDPSGVTQATTPTTTQRKPYTRVNITPKIDATQGIRDSEIKQFLKDGEIDENDWVVSLGDWSSRKIYDGSESRDRVRSAYSTLTHKRIQLTRSRRVKNVG